MHFLHTYICWADTSCCYADRAAAWEADCVCVWRDNAVFDVVRKTQCRRTISVAIPTIAASIGSFGICFTRRSWQPNAPSSRWSVDILVTRIINSFAFCFFNVPNNFTAKLGLMFITYVSRDVRRILQLSRYMLIWNFFYLQPQWLKVRL